MHECMTAWCIPVYRYRGDVAVLSAHVEGLPQFCNGSRSCPFFFLIASHTSRLLPHSLYILAGILGLLGVMSGRKAMEARGKVTLAFALIIVSALATLVTIGMTGGSPVATMGTTVHPTDEPSHLYLLSASSLMMNPEPYLHFLQGGRSTRPPATARSGTPGSSSRSRWCSALPTCGSARAAASYLRGLPGPDPAIELWFCTGSCIIFKRFAQA